MYSRYPLVSEYQVQTLRLRREKSRCAPHHSLHRIHPLAAPCKLARSQTKRNKIQHSPQRRNKRASEKPTNQLRQKTKQLPSFSLPTEINHLGKKIGGLARVEGLSDFGVKHFTKKSECRFLILIVYQTKKLKINLNDF